MKPLETSYCVAELLAFELGPYVGLCEGELRFLCVEYADTGEGSTEAIYLFACEEHYDDAEEIHDH